MFSLASIGTIISCLFIFGIVYAVVVNFQSGMKDLESNVTISIFFDEGIADESVQLIGEQIRVLDYVNTMDFVSADEAFDRFCEQNYDDPEAAKAAFGDDNPLKNSASYEVTLKDVSKQAEFVAFAKDLDGVRNVRSSEVTADSISTLSSLVGYASIGIVVILMLVSVFLISNTITIGITVRKEEIAIMKLIGATNFFCKSAIHYRRYYYWSSWFGDSVVSALCDVSKGIGICCRTVCGADFHICICKYGRIVPDLDTGRTYFRYRCRFVW